MLLENIPPEQKEKVMSQFVSRIEESKVMTRKELLNEGDGSILIETAEKKNIEIRSKEVTLPNGEKQIREYIVHSVDAEKDTLFKICYLYKVNKKEIMDANDMHNEELFYMKELLVPYKNQVFIVKPQDDKSDKQAQQYKAIQI